MIHNYASESACIRTEEIHKYTSESAYVSKLNQSEPTNITTYLCIDHGPKIKVSEGNAKAPNGATSGPKGVQMVPQGTPKHEPNPPG